MRTGHCNRAERCLPPSLAEIPKPGASTCPPVRTEAVGQSRRAPCHHQLFCGFRLPGENRLTAELDDQPWRHRPRCRAVDAVSTYHSPGRSGHVARAFQEFPIADRGGRALFHSGTARMARIVWNSTERHLSDGWQTGTNAAVRARPANRTAAAGSRQGLRPAPLAPYRRGCGPAGITYGAAA